MTRKDLEHRTPTLAIAMPQLIGCTLYRESSVARFTAAGASGRDRRRMVTCLAGGAKTLIDVCSKGQNPFFLNPSMGQK